MRPASFTIIGICIGVYFWYIFGILLVVLVKLVI